MPMQGEGQGNVCMAVDQCRMSEPIRKHKASVRVGGQPNSGCRSLSRMRKAPGRRTRASKLASMQQSALYRYGCGKEGIHVREEEITGVSYILGTEKYRRQISYCGRKDELIKKLSKHLSRITKNHYE